LSEGSASMRTKAKSTVRGTVLAGALACVSAAAGAADLMADVRDASGNPVVDAVVLATPKMGSPAARAAPAVVDQVDREFVPYVSVVQAGASVSFPNRDNVRHHVYSLSAAKKFELPLYAGTPAEPVLFDRPGLVSLGCNIHDWMIAHVYVADTPYFAKTGADGKAKIPNLRPGEYSVRIWHPEMEGNEIATVQKLTVDAAHTMEMSWQIRVRQAFRPRRVPASGGGSYR
jgi:plastocyanin